MGVKEFIYYLLNHGRQLVKHYPHSQFRPRIAILSSLFDFPCNLKDSKCAASKPGRRCCCMNCGGCIGHFEDHWPCDTNKLAYYAGKFTRANGFWRPGKGCILPRHRRSLTCAFYICSNIQKEFDKCNDDDILNLRWVVGSYTGSNYIYGSGRNGQYAKDIVKTETDLYKAVWDFMWKRNLYYSDRERKLIRVVKKKIKGRFAERHFENGSIIHTSLP